MTLIQFRDIIEKLFYLERLSFDDVPEEVPSLEDWFASTSQVHLLGKLNSYAKAIG